MEKTRKQQYVEKKDTSNEANEDYVAYFRRQFGRDPSKQEVAQVVSKVSGIAGKKDIKNLERTIKTEDDALLNDTLVGARKANNAVYSDITAIIDSLKAEERENKAEKAEKKQRRNSFFRKLSFAAIFGSLIGSGVGFGIATYNSSKNPLVVSRINNYDNELKKLEETFTKKNAELENHFFGPLENLTEKSTPSTLTPLERELYASAYLGEDIGREISANQDFIYNQALKDYQIVAKKFNKHKVSTDKFWGAVNYDAFTLAIIKYENNSEGKQGISSINLYVTREDKIVEDSKPIKSISFNDNELKVVDYENNRFSRIVGNRIAYEGKNIELYKKNAEAIIKEFELLYQRGPNFQQNAEKTE